VRVALWGIGNHAKNNLIPALNEAKNIEFIGVYSRNKANVSEVISTYRCRTWTTSEEMVEDKGLDAIVLSTPPGVHFQQGMEIISSGKHLLVEKPITTNLKETLTLLKEAKERNLLVLEGFMFLYHPHFEKIKQIINKEKSLLKEIEVSFELPTLLSPGYRFDKPLGGSCLYDVGSYTVISILELFKDCQISLINSKIKLDSVINIDISGQAYFVIDGYIKCNLTWSYNSDYKNKIIIKTEDKEYISDMVFSKQQDFPPLVKVTNRKGETSEEEVEARNHFVSMLEFFSSSSFSERISDFEREKIERLASFLEKIKGDILNFS
jgi:dTDP-3,4-didehydro-2,6-dideoxy-alpha-D-glucose 3-reductase